MNRLAILLAAVLLLGVSGCGCQMSVAVDSSPSRPSVDPVTAMGRKAFENGRPESDNPFTDYHDEFKHIRWLDGYIEAKTAAEKRP